MDQNYLFKVLVVGCGGVGKTCCIRKLVYNTFTNEYKTTIGVDFAFKVIKINYKGEDIPVRLQLWDIAGQERFSNLTRAYYKDAFGCLVVGDLETDSVKQDVQLWKADIDAKVMFPETTDKIPCVLMANKIDKPKARENYTEILKAELATLNFDGMFGTSAATGEGLDAALECLCRKILQKVEQNKPQGKTPGNNGIINPEDETKKKAGCC
ncbi:Rab32 [Hexamita inflata]|uniref:Putative n=1 Tax=Hexamita inflata TaxID=28002 RepID=A0AA86QEL4_9EUKA|nr:Rab32 [Hexamita inflata]CAI9954371.1 Rab32 [Hexamita inflata]CAI9954832.1 Rab32 [Hexamita inflata]CAI9977699.1 Rab32 [Hexamita inflata]